MKKWAKVYNQQYAYAKKVAFNPLGTKLAAYINFIDPLTIKTVIYTMNAADGTSLQGFDIPIKSEDSFLYEMRDALIYDSSG